MAISYFTLTVKAYKYIKKNEFGQDKLGNRA